MRNLITIFQREFSVYFQSLIGYIFIICFLLFGIGLFITPFFTFPMADMRNFFNMLPIILCIFIPAVTMRLWAEERKDNTFEMIMTFPMRSYEVVLGKFLSALAFYLIALAGTLILPVMLMILGNPDVGQILTSYLGAALLGGLLLALGIFISGLCQDQIVAFVFTLLVNMLMFLFGTDFIQSYVDSVFAGFGSTLGQMIGFNIHFSVFARGIIEFSEILFFLSWIVVFLFLNGFYLEIRTRPSLKMTYGSGVIMALAIGMLFNWVIIDSSMGRFDLTEGKIHTVSAATKRILAKLKVPVNVKIYISPKEKMPTELKSLEQDIVDKVAEMEIASAGNVHYDVVYMEAANVIGQNAEEPDEEKKSDAEKSVEKRMLDKGIKPFSARAIREDSVVNVMVYSAIGIAYKDKKEEILPQIVPQNIHELEYLVVSGIYKMTRDKMPVVALVAPKEAVKINPMMRQIYEQMGRPLPQSEDPYVYLEQILTRENYDVRRVELTEKSPLPADIDTLVVVNPRDLTDRQKFEINKALVEGINVFLAVQKYNWNYHQVQDRRMNISRQEETPKIDDLLNSYGVSVSSDILMDENHQPLTVSDPSNPLASMMGGGMTLNLPIQILLLQESMNPDVSITSRLSGMFYLWGSPLTVSEEKIKANKLKLATLMTTSQKGWTTKNSATLTQESFNPPVTGQKKVPVAVMVTGQFPNFFQDKPIPVWDEAQKDKASKDPFKDYKLKPGKMILVGGTQMFRKNFLQRSNLDFFLNSVDALSLGEDLINVRAKKVISRIIAKPSKGQKSFWKFVNYFLINFIVAMIGFTVFHRRRKSREQYTQQIISQSV